MDRQQLLNAFDSFNNRKVLIIGDVMIDTYLWGTVDRISPEAPVPVVSCTKRESRLGGAANVALNIMALGACPILCSVIGCDTKANTFFELMELQALDQCGIMCDATRLTTEKIRIIGGKQQMLRVDEEITTALTSDLAFKFMAHLRAIINDQTIDAIVFQDYDKGTITPVIIQQTVELANSKSIPVLVDPKKRNFLFYKNVTLFKPNFKEFIEGLKLEISKSDFEAIHSAAIKFQESMSIDYLMITLSELGVFIHSKGLYYRAPAHIRDIADVSGAGDTVISITALCVIEKFPTKAIAAIANLAGGLVCEKVGVVPIDKQQLLDECLTTLADFSD